MTNPGFENLNTDKVEVNETVIQTSNLALHGLKRSIRQGSTLPLIHFLDGHNLSHADISRLTGVQRSTVTKWFDSIEHREHSEIRSREAIQTTVAVIEYIQSQLDCEGYSFGEFLRSYMIDPKTHEPVEMLALLREGRTAEVIRRAGEIFPEKSPTEQLAE